MTPEGHPVVVGARKRSGECEYGDADGEGVALRRRGEMIDFPPIRYSVHSSTSCKGRVVRGPPGSRLALCSSC
ncbi:unnamed protein product [Euphydryas editha]|uniref:Uncharacterized protein n=1 Tax=Euphydryas editha TaxID=104508 RepID=A0AAU9TFM9_EUPED|nr:unnamed protein product [Euphydryas editha]